MQAESTSPEKAAARRRGGRPSAEQQGDVDRRILAAATRLFLRFGFDATSCDQVAVQAGAGKASIYARYANKEELFAAVVRHNVERTLEPSGEIPWHLPLDARLRAVGHNILSHTLQPDVIGLMRVVITTAYRMPELAGLAQNIGRDRGVRRVAEAIVGLGGGAPGAIERATPMAAKFIDLVFGPHQMRALVGESPADLEADAPRAIDEAIALLSASGGLTEWR